MKINQKLVSESKYNIKCPYEMKPEFIVVHNTANDASAANEISYMVRNNNEVSFHFAVDNEEIWQGVPLNRNTWNAGDGAEGIGNRKGISIEICYSKSGGERFMNSEILASKFIAELLHERNWGIDKVTKHQDYNGKNCPHRTMSLGWDRFLKMIQEQLDELKNSGILYRVQVGAFTQKANAEALANELKADGYDAFIVESEGKVEETAPEPPKPEIKVGSNVKVKQGAKTYTGGKLASFVYTRVHVVKELDGDRAVITYKGTVVCAIHKDNLILQ